MSNEKIKKFAQELKSAREEKEVTLQQIFNKTRIDMKFLRAIEEGEFDIMPEIYIRAFIKEYAQVLELDQAEILTKYKLAIESKSGEETAAERDSELNALPLHQKRKESGSTESFNTASLDPEIKKNLNIYIYSIGAAFVVLMIFIYFVFIRDSAPEIITEKPYNEIIQEQKQRFEVKNDLQSSKITSLTDSLTLRIMTTDTSWFRITTDNQIENEFILYPNRVKTLRTQLSFTLLIGNSGGVLLFLDDAQLPLTGKKGEVKYVQVDAGGLQYLQINTTPVNE